MYASFEENRVPVCRENRLGDHLPSSRPVFTSVRDRLPAPSRAIHGGHVRPIPADVCRASNTLQAAVPVGQTGAWATRWSAGLGRSQPSGTPAATSQMLSNAWFPKRFREARARCDQLGHRPRGDLDGDLTGGTAAGPAPRTPSTNPPRPTSIKAPSGLLAQSRGACGRSSTTFAGSRGGEGSTSTPRQRSLAGAGPNRKARVGPYFPRSKTGPDSAKRQRTAKKHRLPEGRALCRLVQRAAAVGTLKRPSHAGASR